MQLDAKTRRSLRAAGHALNPIVTVGERGFTEAVAAELEVALNTHELVKVKLPVIARAERASLAKTIAETAGAVHVQSIGRVTLIYRKRPEESESTERPVSPRRKAPVKKRARGQY
jgi:RNA-binding protein